MIQSFKKPLPVGRDKLLRHKREKAGAEQKRWRFLLW